MTRPTQSSAFANARPMRGLSPIDLADHAAFVREHNARKAAIYDAPLDQRAAMTRVLECETAAFSRGEGRGLAASTITAEIDAMHALCAATPHIAGDVA